MHDIANWLLTRYWSAEKCKQKIGNMFVLSKHLGIWILFWIYGPSHHTQLSMIGKIIHFVTRPNQCSYAVHICLKKTQIIFLRTVLRHCWFVIKCQGSNARSMFKCELKECSFTAACYKIVIAFQRTHQVVWFQSCLNTVYVPIDAHCTSADQRVCRYYFSEFSVS